MTPSELKAKIKAHNPDSHFFDRGTMRSFGDTMRNFGVRATTIRVLYGADGNEYLGPDGQEIPVWELYRKRPVKSGAGSFYFRQDNFGRTFKHGEL